MKNWPKDKNVAVESAEDIIKPLMKVYRAVMKDPNKKHKYTGYDLGRKEKVHLGSLENIATPENLEYNLERDRDVHEVFLWAAFQLGIEQGRRLHRGTIKSCLKSIGGCTSILSSSLKKDPKMFLDIADGFIDVIERELELINDN